MTTEHHHWNSLFHRLQNKQFKSLNTSEDLLSMSLTITVLLISSVKFKGFAIERSVFKWKISNAAQRRVQIYFLAPPKKETNPVQLSQVFLWSSADTCLGSRLRILIDLPCAKLINEPEKKTVGGRGIVMLIVKRTSNSLKNQLFHLEIHETFPD